MIRTYKTFILNGYTVTIAAGVKKDLPLVVLSVKVAQQLSELSDLSIEYPMKTLTSAIRFVESATETTAERGYARINKEFMPFAERLNAALSIPIDESNNKQTQQLYRDMSAKRIK